MEPPVSQKPIKPFCNLKFRATLVKRDTPECILLVLLLKDAQPLLDAMQQVGTLETAPPPVAAHHHSSEAARQHRGPVHVKLLRHHLTTRGPVAAHRYNTMLVTALLRARVSSYVPTYTSSSRG